MVAKRELNPGFLDAKNSATGFARLVQPLYGYTQVVKETIG